MASSTLVPLPTIDRMIRPPMQHNYSVESLGLSGDSPMTAGSEIGSRYQPIVIPLSLPHAIHA
jgi:hypothetical protein